MPALLSHTDGKINNEGTTRNKNIGRKVLNLNDRTFNKRLGNLIGSSFELPYVSYCHPLWASILRFSIFNAKKEMNTKKYKTYHQLKLYKSNSHYTVAGVFVVLGLLMLFGIPSFPKNLFISLSFFTLAYISFCILKTSRPITLTKNSICLGKGVNGYKTKFISAVTIERIELIYEINTKFSPVAMYTGGDVDIHSNYFHIKLKDNSKVKFDNRYEKQLEEDLKLWCKENNIVLDLDVKKIIKENNDWQKDI